MSSWRTRSDEVVNQLGSGSPELLAYRKADAEMISRTLKGYGPDSTKIKPEAGVRVVFNIPAVHVPAFVRAGKVTELKKPYKNRYDLASSSSARIGEKAPSSSSTRERIDMALAFIIGNVSSQSLYYGASELNGAGIRYCLVLEQDEVDSDTLVLDRIHSTSCAARFGAG